MTILVHLLHIPGDFDLKYLVKPLALLTVIVAIIIYSIVRITFTVILSDEYTWFENIFSFMLLFGEGFILLHSIGYAIDLIRSQRHKESLVFISPKMPYPLPEVAVLLAARHEPREVLEGTFRSIMNMRYPSKNIYFLDDSSLEEYKKEAEEIAARFNLKLFRREDRHGAKAGVVNDCLKSLTEKYVVIFDADQNPMPDFLEKLVPIMESDQKLAFVQTPQFYSNITENRIARAAGYQQAVFYEYICEAKGSSEAMFCCGTNVIFRREALMAVGGMDETVVTEDFATSVKFHLAGWRSLYFDHVSTFGMGPETLGAYFQQQSRWAKGTVGVFKKVAKAFLKNPLKLKFSQWWEYFLSGTYYFVGIAFTMLMICPVAYLFFHVPSFFIHQDIYFSIFIPYFGLSLGVFFLTLKDRNYSVKSLFLGQMLTYITFPILIKSAVAALLGFQGTFAITQKGAGRALPYSRLWPQLLFLLLNYMALVWGINRWYYERDFSVLINCIWAFYHFLVMSSLFYFNVGSEDEKSS